MKRLQRFETFVTSDRTGSLDKTGRPEDCVEGHREEEWESVEKIEVGLVGCQVTIVPLSEFDETENTSNLADRALQLAEFCLREIARD